MRIVILLFLIIPFVCLAADTPLADAVAAFNTNAAQDEIGKDQPPLTEDEVLAAIRSFRRHGDQPISDDLLATYQKIAETRTLPETARFEKMAGWEPGGRWSYDVWWVRIRLQRPGGSSYAFPIRERMIRSYDEQPSDLAFGPASEQGLRVACYFVPSQGSYEFDSVVGRRMFFRNDGKAAIEFYAAEEAEDDGWTVVDENDKPIAIQTIRWQTPHLHVEPHKIRVEPGQTARVTYGRTVGLGHGAPADHPGCTIIRADMGQTCRVVVTTRVTIVGAGKVDLKSGEVKFQVQPAK